MRKFFITWMMLGSLAAASPLFAAALGTPTDVSFTANYDNSTQRYVQLLPSEFVSTAPHDVLIALHGSGSDRNQYAVDPREECRATRDVAANHGMIMVCPDYRASTSWMNAAAEADLLQIIAQLRSQYNVGKVFITGGSMGGTGSLTFTALHPELIGGVCSVNGLADFSGFQSSFTFLHDQIITAFGGTESQVPAEYAKRSAIHSPQSFTMPMSITAGGADTVVPPTSVLRLYETVKDTNPKNAKTASFYRATVGHSTPYVDNAVALEYVVRQANGIDTDRNLITINTSFEYQNVAAGSTTVGVVDGWTACSPSAGVARLTATQRATKFNGSVPDGDQLAAVTNTAIYQYLGTKVRAGTYHLSLDVASGKDNAAIGTFLTGFLVAGNNVATVDELNWGAADSYTPGPGLTAGEWKRINFDWIVPADSAAIGKDVYLDFWANSGNTVYVDNVNVTFTPLPEPASLTTAVIGLLGGAAYAWCKRK